ncbi:hypothetical protein LEP1GSC193_0702 [Leptospira phage vB_LalZ_80412-LE1]|nr:hypothetical protein LEP1GSC193_0702 [Leptospira phage vB_LalZ_80412-LE1]
MGVIVMISFVIPAFLNRLEILALIYEPLPEFHKNVGTPTFLNDGKISQKPNSRQRDKICGNSCKFDVRNEWLGIRNRCRFWEKFHVDSNFLKECKSFAITKRHILLKKRRSGFLSKTFSFVIPAFLLKIGNLFKITRFTFLFTTSLTILKLLKFPAFSYSRRTKRKSKSGFCFTNRTSFGYDFLGMFFVSSGFRFVRQRRNRICCY